MNKLSFTLLFSLLCLFSSFAYTQGSYIAKDIGTQFVDDWERAKAYTLEIIELVPEDKIGFKATEESRSFAEQILHSCQGNVGLVSNGTGAERIFKDRNLEKEEGLKNKASLIATVNETYDFVIKSIKEMDTSKLNEMVERGPFNITRMNWIEKGFEHQTHHRGQCIVYLRLLGIQPPGGRLF